MQRFVVDENMPRSTAQMLRAEGHDAVDVRDVGLRGADDGAIFAYAQSTVSILLTADRDFTSVQIFRSGIHAGIIVVRIPSQLPNDVVNREILRTLRELSSDDLKGAMVIVEVGRTRVQRPGPK